MAVKKENTPKYEFDENGFLCGRLLGGFEKDGIIYTHFKMDEMTGATEEQIAKTMPQNPNAKSKGEGKILILVATHCLKELYNDNGDILTEDKITQKTIRQLCGGDIEQMFLGLELMKSFDPKDVQLKCPECQEDVEISVSYEDFSYYFWQIGTERTVKGEFSRPVIMNGKKYTDFVCQYPNGEMTENIADIQNAGKQRTMLISYCLQKVGDYTNITPSFVTNLKTSQRDNIDDTLLHNTPRIEFEKEYKCVSCGNIFKPKDTGVDKNIFFGKP